MTSKEVQQPDEVLITIESIPHAAWRDSRKSALTKARELTDADFERMGGEVETLEGKASFKPGDFLAVGAKGEQYPIRRETMLSTKVLDHPIADEDGQSWTMWKNTITVRAAQIMYPFRVQRAGTSEFHQGKAGDWLVDSGKRQYVVADDIFIETYEFIV